MQLIRHELRAVATTCPPSCSGISLPIHHGPRDAPFDHSLSPRQNKAIANGILCIILHTLFVLIRILSRRICHTKLGWDDYLAILALVCHAFEYALIWLFFSD